MGLAFVDGWVAFSPMPTGEGVARLSRTFKAFVVLTEPWELEYGLDELDGLGVEYIHVPVEDSRSPSLVELFLVSRWIAARAEGGGKVLIHCVGGLGRSGAAAAAYLIYRYGMGWMDAIGRVRALRRGAVESVEQVSTLRAFDLALRTVGRRAFSEAVSVGEGHHWGWGEPIGPRHASKVAHLSLRIWEDLSGIAGYRVSLAGPLAVAALLHDVGRAVEGERHELAGYRVVRRAERLGRLLGGEGVRLASCLVKHHRRRGDPRRDSECMFGAEEAALAGALKIGDALDRSLDQAVLDAWVEPGGPDVDIHIACHHGWCEEEAEHAEGKAWLLEEVLGRRVKITLDADANSPNAL